MRTAILFSSALGFFALGALSLPGCGDGGTSGSGGSGGSTGVTVESACKDLSAALCGRLGTCAPFYLDNGYGDEATCEARATPRCVETADLPGVTFTAETLAACADAYSTQACGDVFTGQVPEACRVSGDKADGASCAAGSECKGSVCFVTKEGQCGTCVTPLAEGEACDVNTQVCAQGHFCSTTCVKLGAKGDACSAMKPCSGGLSCSGGTCGDMLPEGAACASGELCDVSVGLYCNPVSNKCAKFVIAKQGEACGYDVSTGVFTGCEADNECSDASQCVARLKEGDSCSLDPSTNTSHCTSGLNCVAGKCTTGFPSCQ